VYNPPNEQVTGGEKMWLQSFVACALFGGISVGCAIAGGDAKEAGEIKKLVPAATAMSNAEYKVTCELTNAPTEELYENKSLTMLILTTLWWESKMYSNMIHPDRTKEGEDADAKAEFEWLELLIPFEALQEIDRGERRPKTIIHANRITDVTCHVDEDRATGCVSFTVPRICRGKVNYVAVKSDGVWKITEFHMPAHKLDIRKEGDEWRRE